jgi:hypothetical protein
MNTANGVATQERLCVRPPSTAGMCPLCQGPLLPMRGFARCLRCGYALCAGCEAAETPEPAHEAD